MVNKRCRAVDIPRGYFLVGTTTKWDTASKYVDGYDHVMAMMWVKKTTYDPTNIN